MSAELDDATIARWWRQQSARQGLSPKITDEAVLARVVALTVAGRDGHEVPGRDDAPAGQPRRRVHRSAAAKQAKGGPHANP